MSNEDSLRFGSFLLTFLIIASWELLTPRARLQFNRIARWRSNLSIGMLNQLVLRLLFPVLLLEVATEAERHEWGLLNQVETPNILSLFLCFLLLDLAIYTQHLVFHRVPWLWRLHRVHHTDQDFDVSTAVRFHPLEAIVSMLIKMVLVIALGAPALAVLLFEIALSLTALFNHGNISIPQTVDRALRLVLVTPDMHRVHHSSDPKETNSNFGFNLPWWDYLFNTYFPQPGAGHTGMSIGLTEYREEEKLRLPGLLLLPFTRG